MGKCFLALKVSQSCQTLCNPMDYTVRGILQARILEWVAVPFLRGIFPTQGLKQVSYIAGRFFTSSGRYQNKEYILFNSVNSYSIRNELIIFTEFFFFFLNQFEDIVHKSIGKEMLRVP